MVFACSSDDEQQSAFSPPSFLSGSWETSEQEPNLTFYQFTFSENNIIENRYEGEEVYDYRTDFPEDEFTFEEKIDGDFYSITVRRKSGEPIGDKGLLEHYRAFRKGIFQGQEAIYLEFAGTSGSYMLRK